MRGTRIHMCWGIPVDIHALSSGVRDVRSLPDFILVLVWSERTYFREGSVTGRWLHRAYDVPFKQCSHCKDITSHPLAGNTVTTAISATGTSMWDDLCSSEDL